MSTSVDQRKSVRVVAFNSKNVQHLKTVNIAASKPNDPHHSIKEMLQLTAAQAQVQHHPSLMDSGGTIAGLPTVFINGYAGPN